MNEKIEEMASILGNGCTTPCSKCRYANDCGELEGAIKLYEQGYRKESDTVKEVLQKVLKFTLDDEVGMRYLVKNLAKEYGVKLK